MSAPVLQIIETLPCIRTARDAEAAVALFTSLVHAMGFQSGVFLSAVTDDAVRMSIRSLLACDSRWAIEYSRPGWHDWDPWLRYAFESQVPIRSSDLAVHPWEEGFAQAATLRGFRSALVVPAPTSFGAARVGVLVLGSSDDDHFHGDDLAVVKIVARALAMELHEWLLASARDVLLQKTGITSNQIELLRHEAEGHGSKTISAAMGITAKAVDRRFERLCVKLGAADRQIAVRIARLYDVI